MFSQNLDPQPSWGRVGLPSLQVQAGLSDLIKMNSVRQKEHCLTSEAMKQKRYNFRLATQSPSCKEVQTHPHGRPNGVGLCGAAMRSPVNSQSQPPGISGWASQWFQAPAFRSFSWVPNIAEQRQDVPAMSCLNSLCTKSLSIINLWAQRQLRFTALSFRVQMVLYSKWFNLRFFDCTCYGVKVMRIQ